MSKKCIICQESAKFCIKDSSECYCSECAKEHFSDLSYLVEVEEEAKKIKKILSEKIKE